MGAVAPASAARPTTTIPRRIKAAGRVLLSLGVAGPGQNRYTPAIRQRPISRGMVQQERFAGISVERDKIIDLHAVSIGDLQAGRVVETKVPFPLRASHPTIRRGVPGKRCVGDRNALDGPVVAVAVSS